MEKRLYRIKNNQAMLGGVAQGLGEHLGIDVTLIRVLFVLLFFTPFPSFITYFILWVVLPVKYEFGYAGVPNSPAVSSTENINSETSNFTTMSKRNQNNNLVGGAVLIILGVIFSFRTFFDINLWHYIGKMWPVGLVILGVWLIVRDRKSDDFTNFTNTDSSSDL